MIKTKIETMIKSDEGHDEDPSSRRAGRVFFIAAGDELMNDPFGMYPAQRMEQNIELPGIVTEDHQLFRETMM